MVNRIHQKLGTAGFIISIVALVAALGGGAYAATGANSGKPSASAKAKQGKQGKPGKTGPAGPVGPVGPVGPAGSIGAAGAAGADGKTVLSGTAIPASSLGNNGDFYIRTSTSDIYGPKAGGAWGSATTLKGANGSDGADGGQGPPGPAGSPWTAGGTLPPGSTETGVWSFFAADASTYVPSSFNVPLAAPVSGIHTVLVPGAVPAECDDGVAPASSPTHPEADPGYLCVFDAALSSGGTFEVIDPAGGTAGASTAGFVIDAEGAAGDFGFGVWAVTGCGTGSPCP